MNQYASREMSVRTRSHLPSTGTRVFSFGRPQYALSFIEVTECPACGRQGTPVDYLNRGVYRFGRFDIPYPGNGRILIQGCGSCGLLYKAAVPDRSDLRRLYAETGSALPLNRHYHYRHEREYVMRFAGERDSMDILDVGPGNGALLAAFHGIPGRRSALSALRSESCAKQVSGEYILQQLDDPIQWSGEPYDVVLAFDVLEHLFQARQALSNLASLIRPGGLLLVQTGDAAFLNASSRLRDWWYLNLLEHNMAWTPESLSRAAKRAGLRLEHSEIGRHKDSRYMPSWKRAGICTFRTLSRVPGAVPVAVALTSHDPRLLCQPGSDDHFTAVLRRRSE